MELFLPRRSERLRGAAAGREFFCFFDPDETGDIAGESREPRKFAEPGKNRSRNGGGRHNAERNRKGEEMGAGRQNQRPGQSRKNK
jgi:hypothetical protein